MKYLGSKSRIAKQIVPIIQAEIDKTGWDYYEPFCGGCNVIDKIAAKTRYASDNNYYLIKMWRHLTTNPDGEYPDEITYEHYSEVRANMDDYPAWYVGYVGFLASYNGRFFDGGYAKTLISKAGVERNYYQEAKRNVFAQLPNVIGTRFFWASYTDLKPHEMVIYCDPPYAGTKQYATSKDFDHDDFWNTMREWSKDNVVFISEEHAPDDFICVWEQEITRTQDNAKRTKAVEKLFKYGGGV